MNKREMQNEILAIFKQKLEMDIPSVDLDLMETGYLDSLRFVEFLAALEEKFKITLSVEDLEFENFKSVEKIAEFLQSSLPVMKT